MNEYILNLILYCAKRVPKLGRGAQQEIRMITTKSILFPSSFPICAAPELVFSIHLFPFPILNLVMAMILIQQFQIPDDLFERVECFEFAQLHENYHGEGWCDLSHLVTIFHPSVITW